MVRHKFLLFGDSITQYSFLPGGWGAALTNSYSRKADVVVRGFSGYNSRWALFLLDKIFPTGVSNPPSLVTVFFGANDAALLGRKSEAQHVPLPEYKENLHRIISHVKGLSPSTKIVLITPPPIDVTARLAYARATYGNSAEELPERTNEAAGEYAKACKLTAQEAEVPVIDLWSLFQENPKWKELYLNDGLHLTPEGNAVVFEELVKVLKDISLAEEKLPLDFPLYSDIDPLNPEKTFRP